MKKNKKLGKGGMDLHNMDASTVAQMMQQDEPADARAFGRAAGLGADDGRRWRRRKKIGKKKWYGVEWHGV